MGSFMRTKKQKKADTWKDAKIVELSVKELACAAGGRRLILYENECRCKRCSGK